ncbi:MAG: SDR family oxidoreductase [Rhodospirillaceae bacterium]|jgi:NAD(P)-dependent dehydrogenase (short-subunit alcohol dehydrogenase family)|nr:SDR family oxidoreductase [Rhodospirillaceae bacterium]MBT4688653.1 SDR family oxidoreductase [Rhodospirillaceae bacterium]MBT5078997.1 SDR family oxidoreductase [Rhodospirillaceae bacterium]MBT5523416.1 SDR family oxidoreductase [Rhodospirillaceae bacterium]MBT5882447.1 SDR family oxidoreductase [Rhodospirillaceae bacterium]
MPLNNAIDLSGRRILLTGAAGGIGAATARACATLGAAKLLLVDAASAKDSLEALCDELRDEGADVSAHIYDVSSRQDNADLIGNAGDIDAAVACAGICPLEEDWADDPEWDEVFHRVMDVNLLGPIHLARELIPRMAARGGGQIVMIGSIGGRMGGTSPIVQPHYIASKGGVHALIWWLAQRAAPQGVLVNGIAPGPIATAMTATTPYSKERYPLGRLGEPEEIAWPAAFLCSPAASYFSGSILDVNGGLFVG